MEDNSIVTAKATRSELSKVFDRLASRVAADDLVFVFLLGHASFDSKEYKFNLLGPDVTGSELKTYLDRFPSQKVVLVCATPCSGILTKTLSHKNRIIITATKNEFDGLVCKDLEGEIKKLKDKADATAADKAKQKTMEDLFATRKCTPSS